MHFDDRLATVLRSRATGERSARTQFRQLLDLLGERPQGGDDGLRRAAYLRLLALGDSIDIRSRTAIVGETGWRFRNPELVRWFGDAHPHIAAAALARAQLTGEEWAELIPNFPIHARGFLRNRKDLPEQAVAALDRLGVMDRALPLPEPIDLPRELDRSARTVELPAPPAPLKLRRLRPATSDVSRTEEPDPGFGQTSAGIRALLARIEAFKLSRQDRLKSSASDEAKSAGERLAVVDFATDASGRIQWAAGRAAAQSIGIDLSRFANFAKALALHQPARGIAITLRGGAGIEGDWIVDAMPQFTRDGGSFDGYLGRLRRAAPSGPTPQQRDADKLRQLLHELRTPVNAMQGYAEIIQQQMIGPVPHEYRSIAASITSDAARILAGFDELDRLARLETGALDLDEGTSDFAGIVRDQVAQLQNVLAPRVARLDARFESETATIAIASGEAERMAWRLLATLAGATAAGERIALDLSVHDGRIDFKAALPTMLRTCEDIFAAETRAMAGPLSSGIFGAGFSLRLARAEVRAAGGDLNREGDRLVLDLPLSAGVASMPPSQRQSRNVAG
ncbi:sensor histidine kinase [Erythrobacter litoralis]|uniref:histidine kinase dimerization/phospho-acceptor domain-containing protein n=1 Tax=Erythrobacter litoralis TaxID=39960 RepID=UPI002434D459|nr:histidine kinase dimerization/phospho-acceptor domain-containing protein [Erythrobacter litoralis]MDG6078602.1 sensor histidine kinase [Erythrobacter litoralis]